MGLETGTIIALIGTAISAGSATYSIANAEDQKRKAKNSASEQKRLQEEQRRLQDAKNRREARIKAAMVQAQAGSYGGSIYEGAEASIESGADFTSEQIDIQKSQDALSINNNLQQQLGTANAQIGSAIGSFLNTAVDSADTIYKAPSSTPTTDWSKAGTQQGSFGVLQSDSN